MNDENRPTRDWLPLKVGGIGFASVFGLYFGTSAVQARTPLPLTAIPHVQSEFGRGRVEIIVHTAPHAELELEIVDPPPVKLADPNSPERYETRGGDPRSRVFELRDYEKLTVALSTGDASFRVAELPMGLTITWRVKAHERDGLSRTSETTFTTEIPRERDPMPSLRFGDPMRSTGIPVQIVSERSAYGNTGHIELGADGQARVEVVANEYNTVKFQDQPLTLHDGKGSVSINVNQRLLDAPLVNVFQRTDVFDTPSTSNVMVWSFTVANRDGDVANPELRIQLSDVASSLLAPLFHGVKTKPLPFATPPADPTTERVGVLLADAAPEFGSETPVLFGAAGRVRDVGLVALYTSETRRAGSCGPYGWGGEGGYATRYTERREVKVYDAVTTVMVATHTFNSTTARCPESVTTYNGVAESLSSRVPEATVLSWLDTVAKNPGSARQAATGR